VGLFVFPDGTTVNFDDFFADEEGRTLDDFFAGEEGRTLADTPVWKTKTSS
jgi:hypothetical protein